MITDAKATVQDWLSSLTNAGFDIQGVMGYTLRHGPGEEHWNSNYPMVHTHYHLREGKQDMTLVAYAWCGSNWTIYATAFKGRAPIQRYGFLVLGTKEIPISTYKDLVQFLADRQT